MLRFELVKVVDEQLCAFHQRQTDYYQIEKLSLKGSEISMDMMTSLCKMMETCRDDFYEIADYICNLISTFEKKRYRLF